MGEILLREIAEEDGEFLFRLMNDAAVRCLGCGCNVIYRETKLEALPRNNVYYRTRAE